MSNERHDAAWDRSLGHLAGEIESDFVGDRVAPDGNAYERPGLSPAQVLALQTLAAGRGPVAAAQAAQVHRGTVFRWMTRDRAFIEALSDCRGAMMVAANTQLQGLAGHAVAAVRESLLAGNGLLGFKVLKSLGLTQPLAPQQYIAQPIEDHPSSNRIVAVTNTEASPPSVRNASGRVPLNAAKLAARIAAAGKSPDGAQPGKLPDGTLETIFSRKQEYSD